jgi:hypothetical protein
MPALIKAVDHEPLQRKEEPASVTIPLGSVEMANLYDPAIYFLREKGIVEPSDADREMLRKRDGLSMKIGRSEPSG